MEGHEAEDAAECDGAVHDGRRRAQEVQVVYEDVPVAGEADEGLVGLGGRLAELVAGGDEDYKGAVHLAGHVGHDGEEAEGEGGREGEGDVVDDVVEAGAVVARDDFLDVDGAGERPVGGVDEDGEPVAEQPQAEAPLLVHGVVDAVQVDGQPQAGVEVDGPGGDEAGGRVGGLGFLLRRRHAARDGRRGRFVGVSGVRPHFAGGRAGGDHCCGGEVGARVGEVGARVGEGRCPSCALGGLEECGVGAPTGGGSVPECNGWKRKE